MVGGFDVGSGGHTDEVCPDCSGRGYVLMCDHNRDVAAKAVEEAADYLERISPKLKLQVILLRKHANKIRKGENEGE